MTAAPDARAMRGYMPVGKDDGGFAKRLLRAWLEDALRREDFPYSYRELAHKVGRRTGRTLHETTARAWFHGTRPGLELIAGLSDILQTDRDGLAFGPRPVLDADDVLERVAAVKASRPTQSGPSRPVGSGQKRRRAGDT